MHPDIFNNDIFSLTTLTGNVNKQPVVPGRIGQLGLFQESGMSTVTANIECKEGKLQLVKNEVRGAPGQGLERQERKMIPFSAMHLPQDEMVMADEVQGVRAFGTEDELQPVQAVINDKQERMVANLESTAEFHRVGAIQGKVMDSNGTTVITDTYARFGITKPTESVDFAAADFDIRNFGRKVKKQSKKALGNVMVPRFRALCGEEFFNQLISAESSKRAWDLHNEGGFLRDGGEEAFYFGGILWEEYDGEIGDEPLVDADKAHLVPEGVNGLFITRFAPAPLMSAVNTVGLPYYSHTEPEGERGVKLFVQSNPLHLCTVPGSVIELSVS